MKVVFRADASLQIGTGHVMRCLTLADELKAKGAKCYFISRGHPGNLLDFVAKRGHQTINLAAPNDLSAADNETSKAEGILLHQGPKHADWLGTSWQADAQETATFVTDLRPDWLVVDHYALDHHWEQTLSPFCGQLLVIDDLADRTHICDLLLDQNLGHQAQDYHGKIPPHCQILIGPHFSLLRPEFSELRDYSLNRRKNQPGLSHLLINMGGVDQSNATGQVLQALKSCALPSDIRIRVIMGLTAPWLKNVQEISAQMPWQTDVLLNSNSMAYHMANSDLAIGAAGSTSWERCCLGLPTVMLVLAENQLNAALHLHNSGAAIFLELNNSFSRNLNYEIQSLINNPKKIVEASACAQAIADGFGVHRVVDAMTNISNKQYK